jgi:CHASE2 domain-containing sensor protein
VIVGGHWSTFAAGRGDSIDVHSTPVGPIVGAELQANFVEDILDGRTFGVSPAWFLHGTEIILSVIAAVAFALIWSFRGKLSGVLSLLLILLFIQWSVLHLFGVFFDAFVPITGLGLHAIYERLAGGDPASRTKHRRKAR